MGENGHAYLVTSQGSDLPALSIFERLGDGHYFLRARLFPADKDGLEVSDPTKSSATQTIIWSDENGDGQVDPAELHPLPEVVRFHPEWNGQDLSLQGAGIGDEQPSWRFKVHDWTACGAPRYDAGPTELPKTEGELSADGRFVLATTNTALRIGPWSATRYPPMAARCGSFHHADEGGSVDRRQPRCSLLPWATCGWSPMKAANGAW